MSSFRKCLSGLLLANLLISVDAHAAKWELGAGIGGLRAPHYIGADEFHEYVVPAPYFRYESDVLRADRSGVRAVFFESERLAVTLSGSGSLPAATPTTFTRY